MSCTSGCPTQDHQSYAACLKGKGVRVAYCNSAGGQDLTAQKKWDRELDRYEAAVRQGVEPASTRTKDIEAAMVVSNETGTAFKSQV